ncbi:MAG: S8 family serine peptidase, partial [Bacteroidota bacterium]
LTLNNTGGAVDYDGWLAIRTLGSPVVSASLIGGDQAKTVTMPGTASGAITVGSYVTKWSWPSIDENNYLYSLDTDRTFDYSTFSSRGPTRDARQKPEISAPGQGITAALSSAVNTTGLTTRIVPGSKHYLIQGTSMATPHVAGAAALLLQPNPTLTASEIRSFMTSTANMDNQTGAVPNTIWGHGKLDLLEAMVKSLNGAADGSKARHVYEVFAMHRTLLLNGSKKFAVRFTPSADGRVTGAYLAIHSPNSNPIVGSGPLMCEIYTDTPGSNDGIPGTKLGSSVNHPFSQLVKGSYSYIDLLAAGVTVTGASNYHLVLSLPTGGDGLIIRTDDGTNGTDRSSLFTGSAWVNFSDAGSGLSGADATSNLRLQVDVADASFPVSVENPEGVPMTFSLAQNFPNPFNPSTTITYELPSRERVRIRVFDLVGREVSVLFDGDQEPGSHRVQWNGRDANGFGVPSGVYFYRLDGGRFSATRSMVLVK